MNQFDHPVLGRVNYSLAAVPDYGDDQTAAVISLMTKYAVEDSKSDVVKQAIGQAKLEMPTESPEAQIFYYVRGRVRFVADESTALPLQRWYQEPIVESLIRPVDLLNMRPIAQGDCDDFSMLVASMLLAEGIPCSFVTVAADDRDPQQFSHVYVASYRDGKRTPIDASHGLFPGWEADRDSVFRKREWPIRDEKQDQYQAAILASVLLIGVYYASRNL